MVCESNETDGCKPASFPARPENNADWGAQEWMFLANAIL